MPHMPSMIAKNAILAKIESRLNQSPVAQAQHLKGLLNANNTLHDVYQQFLGLSSGDWDVQHLKNDWFTVPGGWWSAEQPISPIIRQGFIEACDQLIAGNGNRRLDCYWVCVGGHVEVWVAKGPLDCVTFVVSTPHPEGPLPAQSWLHGPEDIWVVRSGGPKYGEQLVGTKTIEAGYPVTVVRPRKVAPPLPPTQPSY